jgi:fatty acid desaturase
MDWGLYQVMSVMSRSDVVGSQFLTQTHYGEHTLHHLFPSLDHGLLPQLKPILVKTCKEFGMELLEVSWWHQIAGQFRQLRRLEVNNFKKKPFIKPIIN